MNLVRWRRNGERGRSDIANRYLYLLRMSLMNVPPQQVLRELGGSEATAQTMHLQGRSRNDHALTMIGDTRLRHLEKIVEEILRYNVQGDLLEAGSWRGGACIYLRALLDVYGCRNRRVFACDGWDQGFPPPDPRFPMDADCILHTREAFQIPLEQVRKNFRSYGYLDCQVKFVPGHFKDSLLKAPIGSLALLRLDCDMYGSTWDALDILYDRVSVGGYVIVDDYHCLRTTQDAVEDFRRTRDIASPLVDADWNSVCWMKE